MLGFRRVGIAAGLLIAMAAGVSAEQARIVALDIVGRTATSPAVTESRGAAVVRVRQGDQIEFHWRTDEATELHLHGYDLHAELEPGGTTVMTLDARAAGRFAIESHGFGADHDAEKTLIYLEVLPR